MFRPDLLSELEMVGLRTDAETLFVDTGTFYRPLTSEEFDRATETMTGADTDILIYSGRMSIYPIMARRDRFDEQGQGLIFIRQYRVILPWFEGEIQIRDRFEIVTSRDPQLAGRVFEVRDVAVSTNVGYRRVTVHDPAE